MLSAESRPNRTCRRYSSTSPTIRYSSSTTVQYRSPDGNVTRKARTGIPSTPDATATDPRCPVTESTCWATCTSPRTFVMCTIVEWRQMRQCTTRGGSRENGGSGDDTEYGNLQAIRAAPAQVGASRRVRGEDHFAAVPSRDAHETCDRFGHVYSPERRSNRGFREATHRDSIESMVRGLLPPQQRDPFDTINGEVAARCLQITGDHRAVPRRSTRHWAPGRGA